MKRITYVVEANGIQRSYAGYIDRVPNSLTLYSANIVDDQGVNVFTEAGNEALMLSDIEEFANVKGYIISRVVLDCPSMKKPVKKKPVKKPIKKKKPIRRK